MKKINEPVFAIFMIIILWLLFIGMDVLLHGFLSYLGFREILRHIIVVFINFLLIGVMIKATKLIWKKFS